MARTKVLIMGAAGRDFHNFNVFFRQNSSCDLVAFTVAQIPNIEGRVYPPELSGPLYPCGIPIYAEPELETLISHSTAPAYTSWWLIRIVRGTSWLIILARRICAWPMWW